MGLLPHCLPSVLGAFAAVRPLAEENDIAFLFKDNRADDADG